ncbi:hypothetical protein SAMN05444359_11411 [Neolewinella agarilytica]|uniref:Uncharacterized protein n=1 Tax=Neolewinella agarilytica TaxID=478744 RepID=A0A1H9I2L4_9BACT|nr:hypothetical protein SAMN05444359_11411 [Neolewinella agarilytica]
MLGYTLVVRPTFIRLRQAERIGRTTTNALSEELFTDLNRWKQLNSE